MLTWHGLVLTEMMNLLTIGIASRTTRSDLTIFLASCSNIKYCFHQHNFFVECLVHKHYRQKEKTKVAVPHPGSRIRWKRS